jgi:hypothetical protein
MAPTTATMESQTKIGWDNALHGYLSTDWMALASLDLESPTKYSESHGNARIRKALTCLYKYTQTTWENRNAALHNKEANDLAVSIRSADAVAIKHYHGKPHLLRFDDRHLCERPLSKLLSGSTSAQRRWLRLAHKSEDAYSGEGRTQTTITSFFSKKISNNGDVA